MNIGEMLRKEIARSGADKARSMRCPECSSPMSFREEFGAYFYSCSRYPQNCDVTHSAHANGEPMGKPADAKTRYQRAMAHKKFDSIWQSYRGKVPIHHVRKLAYDWLAQKTGMANPHMASLNEWGCKQVLEACEGMTIERLLAERQVRPEQKPMSPEEKKLFVSGIIRKPK